MEKHPSGRQTAPPPSNPVFIQVRGRTDVGRAPSNEDRILAREIPLEGGRVGYLCAVADGLAGRGEQPSASDIAISTLNRLVESRPETLTSPDTARASLRAAFNEANGAILEAPDGAGAGTTLVAALVVDGELLVANLGDSRCYLATPSGVRQITSDHTGLADAIARGVSVEALRVSPLPGAGGLLRSLGSPEVAKVDFSPPKGQGIPIKEGSFVLLSTDGLTGTAVDPVLEPEEIGQVLYGTPDLMTGVEQLVKLGLEMGSRDNITALGLEYGAAPREPKTIKLRRLKRAKEERAASPAMRGAASPRFHPAFRTWAARLALGALLVLMAGLIGIWLLGDGEGSGPPPLLATLKVDTRPPGATVILDGRKMGRTPRTLEDLPPGWVELGLRLDGYRVHEERLKLDGGDGLSLLVDLEPLTEPPVPARLAVVSTPVEGALVLLDDLRVGSTPLDLDDVEPGPHKIQIGRDGYRPVSQELHLQPGEEKNLTVTLEQIPASVRIHTEPSGAAIRIDGSEAGRSPLVVEDLSPGRHVVEAALEGHAAETWKVELAPGSATGLDVRLSPTVEAAVQGEERSQDGPLASGIAEAERLRDEGFPLQAGDHLNRILPTGLPSLDFSLRIGGAGGPSFPGTSEPGPAPKKVPHGARSDSTYTLSVSPPSDASLRICVLEYRLDPEKVFRLLPDGGRISQEEDPQVPILEERWLRTYRRGQGGVRLFLLLATSGPLSLDEVDAQCLAVPSPAGADPLARGREVVGAVREWFEGRGRDYALRCIWIDEGEGR